MKGEGNKKELNIIVNNGKFNLIQFNQNGGKDGFIRTRALLHNAAAHTLNRLVNKPKTTERKEETLPMFLAQFRFVLKTEGSEVMGNVE